MRIRSLAGLLILLAGVAWAPSADAALITINFDEFAADDNSGAMPAGRYSGLGVTFVATDDGSTHGGLSNGDSGNWGVDGTNGPIFSGFNGGSYGLSMLFSPGITAFSLDVSRTNGSAAGDTASVEVYALGSLIDSATIALGPINTWSTIALAGPIVADEIRIFGTGLGFHPFGIDNVTFQTVPEPVTVLLLGTGVAALGLRRHRRKA